MDESNQVGRPSVLPDEVVGYIRWLNQNTTLKMEEIAKMYSTTVTTVYRFARYEQRATIQPIQPPNMEDIPLDAIKVNFQQINEELVKSILIHVLSDKFIDKVADKALNKIEKKFEKKLNYFRSSRKSYTVHEIAAIKWLRKNTKYSIKQIALSVDASMSYVDCIFREKKLSDIEPSQNEIAKKALIFLENNFL